MIKLYTFFSTLARDERGQDMVVESFRGLRRVVAQI